MSRPEKNLGLSRLRAESRRFQHELLCIKSSLCCPHHQCHHGADSSEASSDTSAWDSPQVPKQLATISFLTSSDVSVQPSINETCATPNLLDCESCHRYSLESPISIRPSMQRNSCSNLEIIASPSTAEHPEFLRKDVSRITATAVFTANAGKLVLNVPRSFSSDNQGLLQRGMPESERERVEKIVQRRDLGGDRPVGEQALQVKSSTSAVVKKDSIHLCNESAIYNEDNKFSDATDLTEDILGEKDLAEYKASGVSGHQAVATEDDSVHINKNMDLSVKNFEEHASPSKSIKPNEAGKDKALAKRMSTRIKFMLQSLDSNKHSCPGTLRYRILNHGTNSRKRQGHVANTVDQNLVRNLGNLGQNHMKGEGIPDPESYLQDVVLALSVSKCQPSPESLQKQRTDIECESKEVMCDLLPQYANYESSYKHSRNKDECTGVERTKIGGEALAMESDKVEDSWIRHITDPKMREDSKCTKGSNISIDGLDHQIEIQNSIFTMDRDDRVFFQGNKNDFPNNAFLQSCRKKVTDLLEGNLILEKQLRVDTVQSTSNDELTIGQLEIQESNIEEQDQPNRVDSQERTNPKKPEDGFSSSQGTILLDRNGMKYQSNQRSRNSSILDSPIRVAVQAANELAKNLAHGMPSANATEEQLSDSQNQRTKNAAKAVQVLIGDRFDYSSMYQELKSMQVERSKLEIRAKTTVQFQASSSDTGVISKQDRIGNQQLLRRRAADGGDSTSGTKRQKTTKSLNQARIPENKYCKKHEVLGKKHMLPALVSSLGISVTDHWDVGIERQLPTTMAHEEKKAPVHMRVQTQGMSKLRFHKTKSKCQVQVNNKRNTTPPDWVERMAQGRPSHDIHEFHIKDSTGKAIIKNLVIRRSVRPPGSIFKVSNPIQWASETSFIKKISLKQESNGSVQPAEGFRIKSKGPRNPVRGRGSSSKTAQKDFCGEKGTSTCHSETRRNADNEVSPNAVTEEVRDEKQKHKDMELSNEESNSTETVCRDLDDKKKFIESVVMEIAEQSLHENMKNEKVSFLDMDLPSKTIADETSSTDSSDEYKKKLEDEVTQGALLAITLQSILDMQSIEINDSRHVVELSNDVPSDIFQSLITKSQVSDCVRMQDCKSVQTTDCNSFVPVNAMIPPFAFFPSFYLPDGTMYPNPSLFCGCTSGNIKCTNFEQIKSSTMAAESGKNKQIFVDTKSEQRRTTQEEPGCSHSLCVRHKDSSSSVTTPSSPASIHEIEDLCETGWNDVNESLIATVSPTEENQRGNSLPVDAKMSSHMLSKENCGKQIGTNRTASEEKKDKSELELKHHSAHKSIKRDQIQEEKLTHSQIELHVTAQEKIEKGKSNLMTVSQATQVPHSRITGEEELQIKKRFSLMPLNDHIYPSVQNGSNQPLTKLEIFPAVRENRKDFLHFIEGAMVPSWSEIKRPVTMSSSSESLSSISIDETSSFSTISSLSLGELQRKAFAILRHSVPINLRNTPEKSNKVHGQSTSLSDTSEGELAKVEGAPANDDLVELGEVILETLRDVDYDYNCSSEGELHFNKKDIGQIYRVL